MGIRAKVLHKQTMAAALIFSSVALLAAVPQDDKINAVVAPAAEKTSANAAECRAQVDECIPQALYMLEKCASYESTNTNQLAMDNYDVFCADSTNKTTCTKFAAAISSKAEGRSEKDLAKAAGFEDSNGRDLCLKVNGQSHKDVYSRMELVCASALNCFSGASCFSPSTTVTLASGKDVSIADVVVGDKVMTQGGAFSAVYNTKVNQGPFNMVEIEHEAGVLSVTPAHLVYANNKRVEASQVKVGDSLTTVAGASTVTAVSVGLDETVVEVMTLDGKLMANGVLASVFVGDADSTYFPILGMHANKLNEALAAVLNTANSVLPVESALSLLQMAGVLPMSAEAAATAAVSTAALGLLAAGMRRKH